MRKLALFSAGFSFAAALFVYFRIDCLVLLLAAAALVLSPVCLKWGPAWLCAVFLGIGAGLLWSFSYGTLYLTPAECACGTQQVLPVVVLDCPEETDYGAKALVEVPLERKHYRAVLYGEGELLTVTPGDTITCEVEVKSAYSPEEVGSMRFYYRSVGVQLLLYSRKIKEIQHGQPSWATKVRLWFQSRIEELYGAEVRPLLIALLTGDQSELSYGLRSDLAVTGLSHAVSVSGLHVAVLLSALGLLCGYNPRLTALLGIPLTAAFVLMTGAAPSACRSAVMQILLLTAPLVRRENDPWTNLAAAGLVLLLENPWSIASVSFQLSFAAVAGLLLFAASLQNRLLGSEKHPGFLRRMMAAGISSSLAATVATLPLTVYYFGLISISAVLVNILALWAMNAMLVLGLVSCLFGGVGILFAVPVEFLGHYVLKLTQLVARFPYAAAYTSNLPLMLWAVGMYGFLVWGLLREKPRWKNAAAIAVCAFFCCVLWGRWEFTHNAPSFRMLDVGQGQCILLELGVVTAAVDCGGDYPEEAGELAAQALHSAGKTRLDVLILTHYDKDHAGGAEQLLHRVGVETVILPDIADSSGMRETIEKAALAAGSRVIAVSELTEITFSDGKITIYPPLYETNDNNSGICVLATASEYDMLITGDLDQMGELRLLTHYPLPAVEVLAVGHHGAESSSGKTFLQWVKPQVAAISTGKGNPYGHPHQETLDRLVQVGAEIFRTDTSGTIVIRRRDPHGEEERP